MPHSHQIYDSDKHFVIDPITRNITNNSSKLIIMQYDHNSERFTFEIPRVIEGHDMSLSDVVRVHFINIGSIKTNTNPGVYEVDDMAVSLDDPDTVTFSWLISGAATEFNGSLNFAIRFYCLSDKGAIEYSWGTSIYSGIIVSNGLENSEIIIEEYVDVLEKWKQDVIDTCFDYTNKIIGNLNDLDTEAKNTLVAAINEAAQTGSGSAMRVDGGYIQYSTDKGKTWVNLIAEADLKGGKGDKGDPGAPGKDGAPGVYYGTMQPTGDTHPVWINPDGEHDDGGLLPAVTASDNGKVLRVVSGAWSPVEIPSGEGVDMGITGATVGQIAKITAVDESGKPTAWSPVDMPTGGDGSSGGIGELRRIAKVTLTEDAASIEITTDEDGNAFELVEYTYIIIGKSLGTSGNVGLKINDALIYYGTDLSNTNTTATLYSGGHGSYAGGWYATYKNSYSASKIEQIKGACVQNIGKMRKFWYGCTSGVAGVGFQAGTVLELWGR